MVPEHVRVTVLSGMASGLTREIGEVPVVCGKDPACQLVLPDGSVSRQHLEIARGRDGIELRDLGSTNGSHYGGASFRALRVGPGAEVVVGDVRLRLEAADDGSPLLLGESPALRAVLETLDRAARSDVGVLVLGETGTGKELAVQHLHRRSVRAGRPLVVCDVGALPAGVVESELFGHQRGAFTGADQERIGAFRSAQGGTLCLDEIGELPLGGQPKLLRALEAREVHPVGADRSIPIDARIVAATHRDLAAEVAAGRFREDLYHRVAVVTVRLPALRERPGDIPLLVRAFVARTAARTGASPELDEATLAALGAYEWPGNVRQLRNVIERACVLAGSGRIDPRHLGLEAAAVAAPSTPVRELPFHDAKEDLVRTWERDYLEGVVARAGRNLSLAARRAGLDRAHLYRLLRKHGLLGE